MALSSGVEDLGIPSEQGSKQASEAESKEDC